MHAELWLVGGTGLRMLSVADQEDGDAQHEDGGDHS
jgi:hypothetical protein